MKVRIAYFETLPGTDDVSTDYDVELNEGESIVSVERCTDAGYNTNWCRAYILVPE